MGISFNTQNTELDPDTNLATPQRPSIRNIDTSQDPINTSPLFFDSYDFTDIYTDPLSDYTKYGITPTRFSDWNEQRAQGQSTGEKWKRGLTKAGITTVGAVAENTLGVLAGMGELFSGGQYYDNVVGQSVDKMNNWAREEMPNYYTQKEEQMGAFERMGTANFWADKAANGLGYSLGSIATMALTGGAGYIGMAGRAMGAVRAASLVDKTAKLHKLYKASKTAARGEKLSKMMGQVSKAQKFKKVGQMADAAIMMSLAESSVESRETKKHTYDTLLQLEMENQGVEYAQDLGAEKLAQIQKDANAAGNANFGMNMGILSVSNAFMFGKMLGPNYVAGQNAIKGIKKTGANKVADATSSGWRKAAKKTSPLFKGMVGEASQEGGQYASNIAASEFANAKYSDRGGITRMEALHEGLSRTFGETEGIESILLGAVTGGVMTGGRSLVSSEVKDRDSRAQSILNILNSGSLDNTVERGRNQERTLFYIEKMEEAREQENEELFEQYRTQAIISNAITLDEAGQIDLYYEKLDDTLGLSDEDFAKEFGYNPDAKFDKHKVVEQLKKDVEIAVKRKNAIDAMFPITRTRGVPRMLMSKEERAEEDQTNKETLMLRDHLLQNAVFLDKVSDRKKDIARQLAETMPGVTLGGLEKAADNAKEQYDSLIEEAILATEDVTSEAGLPQEVKDKASEAARLMYVRQVMEQLPDNYRGNPADNQINGQALSTYYGLHANEQDLFENWNRLESIQGREEWLRVALMDQQDQIREDADNSVEDMIQQETDPEKIAKNTNPNASRKQKRKSKKESKNINNIKQNIINKFNDPAVSMEEIDNAIEERAGAEEAFKNGFESTEEKQAYIELQVLREIKKQRQANKEQEKENKKQQEFAQKEKEVKYTGLFVNSIDKLKRMFKPVHLNEHYTHMERQARPSDEDMQREEQFIGKNIKLKITGRYKTDRMDVILVEGPSNFTIAGDFNMPYIVLSLADGVSLEDVQDALYYADQKGQIKTYKSPKSIDTTFGYVDSNGNKHTSLLEESAPQETIDSPAKVDGQGQTENVIEEEIGQDAEFTDDSDFFIFEEEFVDPEVLAAELNAQNAEAAAMRGEPTGETEMVLSETFEIKLSQEDQRLVDWLKTPEGSLDNQTSLESATKLALKFQEGRIKARDEGKTEEEVDQYMDKNLSKELMASVGIGFKAIELGPRLEELNIILKKQNELGVPTQELKSIPTQDQLLILEAEERALLEEEAKLINSLNKEDDNCAT